MSRTGEEYRDSIRDGSEVYINGERVKDVTTYPSGDGAVNQWFALQTRLAEAAA